MNTFYPLGYNSKVNIDKILRIFPRIKSEAPRPEGQGFPERKISISDSFPYPRPKRRGLQGSEPVKKINLFKNEAK
jgi:hypothetical protein